MAHWILYTSNVQVMIENLDLNKITLKEAKNYFSVYGVEIKGNTKERFIRNMIEASRS